MPTAHTANALGSQFEFMPSYFDQTMSDAQQLLHFLDFIALLYVHNFCIAAQPWSSQLIVDATIPLLLDSWVYRCCFHCIILRQLWQYCIVASHGIAGLLLDSRAGVAFIADS